MKPDDVARDYDALAAEYANHLADELAHKPFDRAWLIDFAQRMAGRGLVGDLGCGPGHISAFLAEAGAEVLGLDLSPGMVVGARAAHPGLSFEVGDILELASRPGRFAGLLAMYCLIHMEEAALVPALRACRAALHPGGELRIAVHLGEGLLHPGQLWGIPISLGFRMFAPGEMEAALAEAGFTTTESHMREPYAGVEYPSRRLYLTAHAKLP